MISDAEQKLKKKEVEVEHVLQLDGLSNARHLGLKAGSLLRRRNEDYREELQESSCNNKRRNLNDDDNIEEVLSSSCSEGYDDSEEEDPKSDLSINYHTERKGNYDLIENSNNQEDEDTLSIEEENAWIVNELNVSNECKNYSDYCFSKYDPKELDDCGVLALDNIHLFMESIPSSVSRHFGQNNNHQIYAWCSDAASSSFDNWRDIQVKTTGYLNEALRSDNELDLIVFFSLPLFKISGYAEDRGEDSFVHDVLAPLFELVYSLDINIKHFWANVSLTDSNKDIKPDFGVYANGLSRRLVLLVAEIKPIDGRQKLENDKVKIGKEMKIMLNELLKVGIESPVVSGILVMEDHIYTYKMHLSGPKEYIMTQLSSTNVTKSVESLILIPNTVSRLVQLKDLAVEMTEKLQKHNKDIKEGRSFTKCSVPKH